MMRTGRSLKRRIHVQIEAFYLACLFPAADLIIEPVGGHGRSGSQLLSSGSIVLRHLRVQKTLFIQLMQKCDVVFVLFADCAGKILLVFIIPAQHIGGSRVGLTQTESP